MPKRSRKAFDRIKRLRERLLNGKLLSSRFRPSQLLRYQRPKWTERNFLTEVYLPSLFTAKTGSHPTTPPVFPELKENEFGITWIGHASFLIQTHKHNILIDPNWANWLLIIKRIKHAGISIDHLPAIDFVLITHAHFDHLNRKSLRTVAANQPIIVPQGVGNLVYDLGFEKVHELEWWDHVNIEDTKVTFTPANHWGARRVTDSHRGFGGFILEHGNRKLYNSGDTAWFDGFKEIGDRHQPEISILPIGAYDTPSGRDHHMSPEQALNAFEVLGSKLMIPNHFGTYRLSYEPMHEPPQRLITEATQRGCIHQVKFLTEGMPGVF